jgi:hypothetical protein
LTLKYVLIFVLYILFEAHLETLVSIESLGARDSSSDDSILGDVATTSGSGDRQPSFRCFLISSALPLPDALDASEVEAWMRPA